MAATCGGQLVAEKWLHCAPLDLDGQRIALRSRVWANRHFTQPADAVLLDIPALNAVQPHANVSPEVLRVVMRAFRID